MSVALLKMSLPLASNKRVPGGLSMYSEPVVSSHGGDRTNVFGSTALKSLFLERLLSGDK